MDGSLMPDEQAELDGIRDMLDRRYDELARGRVKPLDAEEVYRILIERTATERKRRED